MCGKLRHPVENKLLSDQYHEERIQKIGYYGAIDDSINRNGCVVLIFKEMWANVISALKAAPKSRL